MPRDIDDVGHVIAEVFAHHPPRLDPVDLALTELDVQEDQVVAYPHLHPAAQFPAGRQRVDLAGDFPLAERRSHPAFQLRPSAGLVVADRYSHHGFILSLFAFEGQCA